MQRILLYLAINNIWFCHGVSIQEQLAHIAKIREESLDFELDLKTRKMLYDYDLGEVGPILGAPDVPSHLPVAEPILPGHTLLRPALGMLKSAVKFPHIDPMNGAWVNGNIDNLGIRYNGKNERVLYSGFRRTPSDYIMIVPVKLKTQKPRVVVPSTVIDTNNFDNYEYNLKRLLRDLKARKKKTAHLKVKKKKKLHSQMYEPKQAQISTINFQAPLNQKRRPTGLPYIKHGSKKKVNSQKYDMPKQVEIASIDISVPSQKDRRPAGLHYVKFKSKKKLQSPKYDMPKEVELASIDIPVPLQQIRRPTDFTHIKHESPYKWKQRPVIYRSKLRDPTDRYASVRFVGKRPRILHIIPQEKKSQRPRKYKKKVNLLNLKKLILRTDKEKEKTPPEKSWMLGKHQSSDTSSSSIEGIQESPKEKKFVDSKKQWFWTSSNMYNYIKIDPEAPDHDELIPLNATKSTLKNWWFFNEDDFQGLEEDVN